MNEQTKSEYRKLARHFYKKHGIEKPTAKTVSDALKECATDYRPDYWRRLRSALSLAAQESGFHKAADKIKATKNPITSNPKQRSKIKKKQKRQKSVKKADEAQLFDFLIRKKEMAVFAAVSLVSHLGCRPAELKNLKFLHNRFVAISSAKKTKDGNRGLDRMIEIKDPSIFKSLKECNEMLLNAPYKDPIRYVQRRLDTLTQRLWPKRKVRPSLYSWRHQIGADLKASGMSRAEVSAIMGHQSTESVDVYGNPRSAQSSRSYMSPDKGTVRKVHSRNKHRLVEKEEKITLNYLSQHLSRNTTSTRRDQGLDKS